MSTQNRLTFRSTKSKSRNIGSFELPVNTIWILFTALCAEAFIIMMRDTKQQINGILKGKLDINLMTYNALKHLWFYTDRLLGVIRSAQILVRRLHP